VESFNGDRDTSITGQGNFLVWFSGNAFGGTGYSNTPVGAVSYVEEPTAGATSDNIYFGLWEQGKNLGMCAWGSYQTFVTITPGLQVVGDPFVQK
jgi:hypothetical protein